MVDTKVSALPAIVTPVGTDEIPINDGGVSKKITLDQLVAYDGLVSSAYVASVAAQGAGFASDTYLAGSYAKIPVPVSGAKGSIKAQSQYRAKFAVTKTAAGTATPIITLRTGTAGTTSDTSRGTMTFPAQTAAVDSALIEVFATWRANGASSVLVAVATMVHALTATGFSTIAAPVALMAASGTFDSNVASLGIGLSVNGGTSAAWTVQLVQAELYNLT